MKVIEQKDGTYKLKSNGSIKENCAVSVVIEMLGNCGLSDESFNNSFGCIIDKDKVFNYVTIPSVDFVNIGEEV